jgi:DNA-binding CsgD family transcriptional regulator
MVKRGELVVNGPLENTGREPVAGMGGNAGLQWFWSCATHLMVKKSFPHLALEAGKTRLEQAEARAEQAEARTEQAKSRTEAAETRAEQAETRTEEAKTRTERAETRAEIAEMALERLLQKMAATRRKIPGFVAEATPEPTRADSLALAQLTSRQRQILQRLALGSNTKQIADELALSPKTIEYHRIRLMNTLKLRDITGLVRFALRVGLIPADG